MVLGVCGKRFRIDFKKMKTRLFMTTFPYVEVELGYPVKIHRDFKCNQAAVCREKHQQSMLLPVGCLIDNSRAF